MGIVFRQSAKNMIVVVAGALLGSLIIWLSTKFNSQRQYGSLGILTNYSVFFSQIFLLGLHNTMAVFIHRYSGDAHKKKALITISFFLPLLVLGLFSLVFALCRNQILPLFQPQDIPFMEKYFYWFPVFTLFMMYVVVMEQYLGSQLKVAAAAFMREVVLRVANIVLILLFAYNFINFNTLVIGTVLVYMIPVVIFCFLSVRTRDFGISFRLTGLTRSDYREIIHFSWYHFLLNISNLMLASLDMMLLPIYDKKGSVSVAIYRVAIFFISFLQMPYKAMLPASFTVLAKAFADDDHIRAKDIYLRTSLNVFILSIIIVIMIVCNLHNAVSVIGIGYSGIIPVFSILFVGAIINIACGMNDQVLSITNYYKFNFYLSLIVMVLLYFMLRYLIPVFGVAGAALSTASSFSVFSLIKSYYVWKKQHMQPFTRKTLLVVVAALPAFIAGYYLPDLFSRAHHIYVHAVLDTIIRSLIIVSIYVLLLFRLKPSPDLAEYVRTVRTNKRLF